MLLKKSMMFTTITLVLSTTYSSPSFSIDEKDFLTISRHEDINRATSICTAVYSMARSSEYRINNGENLSSGEIALIYDADEEALQRLDNLHTEILKKEFSEDDYIRFVVDSAVSKAYWTKVMEESIESGETTLSHHVDNCRNLTHEIVPFLESIKY
jgi:hypothetical protein